MSTFIRSRPAGTLNETSGAACAPSAGTGSRGSGALTFSVTTSPICFSGPSSRNVPVTVVDARLVLYRRTVWGLVEPPLPLMSSCVWLRTRPFVVGAVVTVVFVHCWAACTAATMLT